MDDPILYAKKGAEMFLDGQRMVVFLPSGGVQLCIEVLPSELRTLRECGMIEEEPATWDPAAVPPGDLKAHIRAQQLGLRVVDGASNE